ncbi:MAG: YitT family protein [Clostridium sp.]
MLQLNRLSNTIKRELKETFVLKTTVSITIGTAITTFGLYNVHQQADITEGGILGLILLLNFWLGMSSSLLSPILDFLSYLMGFKYLGKEFLKTSIFATLCMAGFFRLWELFPPLLPSLADIPLAASVLGGCFIGIGCGLVVRQGASCAGDDALALVISKITGWRISRAYLFTDLTVLVLSLSYIPVKRIIYSLITVTISSYLIDFITNFGRAKENTAAEA